jgi:hypothetical protein
VEDPGGWSEIIILCASGQPEIPTANWTAFTTARLPIRLLALENKQLLRGQAKDLDLSES